MAEPSSRAGLASAVPFFEKVEIKDGVLTLGVTDDGESTADKHTRLARQVGAASFEFVDGLVTQLATVAYPNLTPEAGKLGAAPLNTLVASVAGAKPRDEIEAQMAAQMAVVHAAMMAATARLAKSSNIPQQDSNGNLLNKLARTYAAQVEALARYRGRGMQRVIVEHVTTNVAVAPGGQANVGVKVGDDSAAAQVPGVGGAHEIDGQSHEPRALPAPDGSALLRPIQANRSAMPGTGRERKESLPISRGSSRSA